MVKRDVRYIKRFCAPLKLTVRIRQVFVRENTLYLCLRSILSFLSLAVIDD